MICQAERKLIMSKKSNYLLERVVEIMDEEERGKVLDIGCGDGDYSFRLKNLGFEVIALDLDEKRFKYKNKIEFYKCDITKGLPLPDIFFDYVIFLEVIEHLRNPYFVVGEISRILKEKGKLIISTPNILNLKSRLRFLFEGSFEFFREPLLEQVKLYKGNTENLHLIGWRYHEIEYMLYENRLIIEKIYTDLINPKAKTLMFFLPLLKLQLYLKRMRSIKKKGIDYTRIHHLALSKELLYGRHLILKARKI